VCVLVLIHEYMTDTWVLRGPVSIQELGAARGSQKPQEMFLHMSEVAAVVTFQGSNVPLVSLGYDFPVLAGGLHSADIKHVFNNPVEKVFRSSCSPPSARHVGRVLIPGIITDRVPSPDQILEFSPHRYVCVRRIFCSQRRVFIDEEELVQFIQEAYILVFGVA